MIRAYKYRLYPTKKQANQLHWVLDRCRELYNAALQERRDAHNAIKQHPSYYDVKWRKQAMKEHAIDKYSQYKSIPTIREIRPEYKDIPVIVLRDPLQRVDRAFQAFFRRVKQGETPGYPRFQGKNRYDSFTYIQAGCTSLVNNKYAHLSGIGEIKIRLHRPLEGKIKTTTVKREGEQWYIIFICEAEQELIYHPSEESIGVDLGLLHFATLSTGETIENPRYFRKAESNLKRLQQSLTRKRRGSNRHKKTAKQVAKAHRKVRNQRRDFLSKASRNLVNRYQAIVFENLATANLSRRPKPKQDEETSQYLHNRASQKAGLNKSINDAGWSRFVQMCAYKAESAGGRVVQVDPRYTSQTCSGCGAIAKKELSERWHSCTCGCEMDRDHNAAVNILRLGLITP